ncbi:hypothetical protein CLAFUW4_06298 [Fulvia fulva]|nr:hypothetical protein CLAFUR4_06301 [Fulvia fulva]WPV15580.1 hypothetical protein CLAFUW4_06298 [Fulvia fulva]
MYAAKGNSRKERSFIGNSCAACDEPVEHMLRGERVQSLSCGHVAHEACLYEYISEFKAKDCPTCGQVLGLDTTRGGNLDFEKFNKIVRDAPVASLRERWEPTSTPLPWEPEPVRRPSTIEHHQPVPQRPAKHHLIPAQQQGTEHDWDEHLLPAKPQSIENYEAKHNGSHGSQTSHGRTVSGETNMPARNDYSDVYSVVGRRHDYDVQSMEASVKSPRHLSRYPIPAPTVTVRSEFPTLSKSRHQQSLTCLVTVEVVEGSWQPQSEDLRSPPAVPSPIPGERFETPTPQPTLSFAPRAVDSVHEDLALIAKKEELFKRVVDWHGLDFERFGKLILHGIVRVGKNRQSWQELECYLFSEMLICVKEKKVPSTTSQHREDPRPQPRCTLKGSILIRRHLKAVELDRDEDILTLILSVAELPAFHLHFNDSQELETWRRTLNSINRPEPPTPVRPDFDHDASGTDEEDYVSRQKRRISSLPSSSYGATRSQATAPTEYSGNGVQDIRLGTSSLHVPLDIVVVVPVSASMHGLKINLLRDALRFLVSGLGERDRMGLVTFGSGGGGVPLVGMATKSWQGWSGALESIQPIHHKTMRADVVEGASVAMDLLMQRRSSNPLSHILLISDSAASETESVEFVVQRAEAAKVGIHSFGLGLTHKPDAMVELSTKTMASYTYVKDWMMLRECLAGCIGALQSVSHQNAKLRLRLPEGSPAKFVKISGAFQITKRATGRDAEASLGDLRFGDKRDVLVQLAIQPENSTPDSIPSDPWESMISGLEALGPIDQEDQRTLSVEELPLLQADLVWSDVVRDCQLSQLPRPSLLAITMLPSSKKTAYGRPVTPPIPPHPSIVQRRMELLTSDMLSRALSLVSRGQHERAHHLLSETRSILKGLAKGGLPPLPSPAPTTASPPTPRAPEHQMSALDTTFPPPPPSSRSPISPYESEPTSPFVPAAGIDRSTMLALDMELESSLEWICHPAVFSRDARKAVLQAIGVVSSQRGYTFRTASEALWAGRIPGVRRLTDRSREWRQAGDERIMYN